MASREARANGRREDTSESGTVPLDQPFDRDSMYALRAAVAAHATTFGAPPGRVSHLVIIASELASNAVQHGGGAGRLRLWRDNSVVCCQVSDRGLGLPDPARAGTQIPPALVSSGRGLWIVRRLTVALTIDSTDRGTTVTATVPLAPPEAQS
jgi:anti-sigma regulatory factor (Ser/Thr protein kinase)